MQTETQTPINLLDLNQWLENLPPIVRGDTQAKTAAKQPRRRSISWADSTGDSLEEVRLVSPLPQSAYGNATFEHASKFPLSSQLIPSGDVKSIVQPPAVVRPDMPKMTVSQTLPQANFTILAHHSDTDFVSSAVTKPFGRLPLPPSPGLRETSANLTSQFHPALQRPHKPTASGYVQAHRKAMAPIAVRTPMSIPSRRKTTDGMRHGLSAGPPPTPYMPNRHSLWQQHQTASQLSHLASTRPPLIPSPALPSVSEMDPPMAVSLLLDASLRKDVEVSKVDVDGASDSVEPAAPLPQLGDLLKLMSPASAVKTLPIKAGRGDSLLDGTPLHRHYPLKAADDSMILDVSILGRPRPFAVPVRPLTPVDKKIASTSPLRCRPWSPPRRTSPAMLSSPPRAVRTPHAGSPTLRVVEVDAPNSDWRTSPAIREVGLRSSSAVVTRSPGDHLLGRSIAFSSSVLPLPTLPSDRLQSSVTLARSVLKKSPLKAPPVPTRGGATSEISTGGTLRSMDPRRQVSGAIGGLRSVNSTRSVASASSAKRVMLTMSAKRQPLGVQRPGKTLTRKENGAGVSRQTLNRSPQRHTSSEPVPAAFSRMIYSKMDELGERVTSRPVRPEKATALPKRATSITRQSVAAPVSQKKPSTRTSAHSPPGIRSIQKRDNHTRLNNTTSSKARHRLR